jgi:hypothetical protein
MTRAEEMEDLIRWLDADPEGTVQILRGDQIVYFRTGPKVYWPLRCSTLRDSLIKARDIEKYAERWNATPAAPPV